MIVSETLVRDFKHGEQPLGLRLDVGNDEAFGGFGPWPGTPDFRSGVLGNGRRTYEIVGVDVTEDIVW